MFPLFQGFFPGRAGGKGQVLSDIALGVVLPDIEPAASVHDIAGHAVGDIGLFHLAAAHPLDLVALAEVDAPGRMDIQDEVVLHPYAQDAVVSEDAPVSVMTVNVMDIIVADDRPGILGPDIDGARIDQHPHRLAAERFRHIDFIVLHHPGGNRVFRLREMGSDPHGRIGEILEEILRDAVLRPLAQDGRRIGQGQAHVPEGIPFHPDVGRCRICRNAPPVTAGDRIVPEPDAVRRLAGENGAPDSFEGASGHDRRIGLEVPEPDERLPCPVAQETDSFDPECAEPAVLEPAEGGFQAPVRYFRRPVRRMVDHPVPRQTATIT